MDAYETIADRRIKAAREAGLFDDLPGAGLPIPDLGRQRPPGWWATRLAREERSALAAEELEREIKAAMPALWRLGTEADVRARIAELNETIGAYNRIATTDRRPHLDESRLVLRWHQLRHHELRHRLGHRP